MGDHPTEFEETWESVGTPRGRPRQPHGVKLDDNVNIGVLLRQAPPKLRDNLLVESSQFESTNNNLRAMTHANLNSDKSWIANDSRSDTKGSDLIVVDCSDKDIGKDKGRGKAKEQDNGKSKSKNNGKNQGKRAEPDKQDK